MKVVLGRGRFPQESPSSFLKTIILSMNLRGRHTYQEPIISQYLSINKTMVDQIDLIDIQMKFQDNKLLPQLSTPYLHDQFSNLELPIQDENLIQSNTHQLLDRSDFISETSQQMTTTETPPQERLRQNKTVIQLFSSGGSEGSREREIQPATKGRRRRAKEGNYEKKQHETKNFLAAFKVPHFKYLKKHCQFDKNTQKWVENINRKDGISLQDYDKLYAHKLFKPIFNQMFREKYLYRALMVSRCQIKARKNYIGKIWKFKKAFDSGKFDRIN